MNVYDFKAKNRLGEEVSLSEYKGKVLLIMNSATLCGFTPQYAQLQAIYDKHSPEGFVLLDFPSNQFGSQAPGTDEEIHTFCDANYSVTFPVFSKIDVNGDNAHPLFKYLVGQKGFQGFNEEHPIAPRLIEKLSAADPEYANKPSIKWNFTKFLIDRTGNVIERFEPTEDLDVVEKKIIELL